jgi:hypothetical protein
MAKESRRSSWSGVKSALRTLDADGLTGVIRDLYEASPDNRRFLHARFLGSDTELEKYRALILDAVYPNLFGHKPVRIGEAQRLVRHFEQATGHSTGALDLMLTLVEAGTDLAADAGYGDDAYFGSLEKMLLEAIEQIRSMPANEWPRWQERLDGIVSQSASIGWGYCDVTRDIVASLNRGTRH